MGSVIAHTFAGRYGDMLDGLALSGVVARPNMILSAGTPLLCLVLIYLLMLILLVHYYIC